MISLEPQWIVLDGMSYGLNQPSMSGVINAQLSENSNLSVLKRIVQMWTDVDVDVDVDVDEANQAELIIKHILVWQSRIQQQHKIPTFEKHFIRKLRQQDDTKKTKLFIVIPYSIPEVTRDILTCIIHVVNYSLENIDVLKDCTQTEIKAYFAEATVHLDKLRTQLNKVQLAGMNTYWFIHAATELGIHVSHIAQNTFSFGTGVNSILMDSSFTENTSVIGSKLSKSKASTALLLQKSGLPASEHVFIRNEKQLPDLIEKMGYPLVIKPDNLDQGQGVFAYLTTFKQVKSAFKAASQLSKQVLLEKHVKGDDYRLTVLNNQVIKIVQRTAAGVTGDGTHSVRQLLEIDLQSPYAKEVFKQTQKPLISLDSEALELLTAQSIKPESIPEKGQYIALRRKNNMSTGGTVKEVKIKDVHPDNIALAIKAARVVNLDLAGIDLITQDIKSSWLQNDAIICEINAQPQIGATIKPETYQTILLSLLKQKIGMPIHLFILPTKPDETDITEFLSIAEKYKADSVSSQLGIYINNKKACKPFINGFVALKTLTLQKDSHGSIALMTHKEVELMGLPLARFESIVFCTHVNKASATEHKLISMVKPHSERFSILSRDKFYEL